MAETVLVTGGTGFVAGWVIVELLKRGYRVRATVRELPKGEAVRAEVAQEVNPGDRLSFVAADLMDDAGWAEAMAGADYGLHVASPLGRADGKDLIETAREGTLQVLKAAVAAGVRRVVVTSSTAACAGLLQGPDSVQDETTWTDLNDPDLTDYRRSKIIAERAAWDFMATAGSSTELVTVLPSAIFGPVMSRRTLGSVMVVGRMASGKMPGVPKVGFSVVDVRDLALAHVLAMETPAAAGQRLIACGDYLTMSEMAAALRGAGLNAPKRTVPNVLIRWAAKRDAALSGIAPTLGRRHAFKSDKAQRLLGWRPRPSREVVVDTAKSLISVGAI
jgi:nucleoside-diphosphate-sugar epimerase